MAKNYTSELHRHKTADLIKWIIVFVLLFAVMGGTITALGLTMGWFKTNEEKTEIEDVNYFQATPNDTTLIASHIPTAQYAEYGIAPYADSAYVLTATITPSNASDKSIEWTVSFDNSESEWASGKDVEDYVTVSPNSENSNVATVTCLNPFSEKINVMATSNSNPDKSAVCVCDYIKRLTSFDVNLSNDLVSFGNVYTLNAIPQYSDGTITGTYTEEGYTVELTQELKETLMGLGWDFEGKKNNDDGTYHVSYIPTVAALNVNLEEHQFSFNGTSAYEVFGPGNVTFYKEGGIHPAGISTYANIDATASLLSQLKTKVNEEFKSYVTENANTTHMTLKLNFTYCYNNVNYAEATVIKNLRFDADTLAISVNNVQLDNDNILF